MYRKAIKYTRPNGQVMWLAPGSKALELYEQRLLPALNRHLNELDKQAKARGELP